MKQIKPRIFQNNVLSIFTDASVEKTDTGYTTCAGAILILETQKIAESYVVLEESTNNQAEIYAIYLGLTLAINACKDPLLTEHISYINLYSDSKISIFGIREWVYSWIQRIDSNGVLISSSGKPVANQYIFKLCFNLICEIGYGFKKYINFYHIYGHGLPYNFKFKKKYMDHLKKENDIYDKFTVYENDVIFMIDLNNAVDFISRNKLTIGDPAVPILNLNKLAFTCIDMSFMNHDLKSYIKGGK